MKQWNADNQILLSEQSMLDLFMGAIYKLDKLNEVYQQSSKPSPKPRLSGAFREGGSLVSPTILECIRIGLIKLTIELELRNMTVFKHVPILFTTYEVASRSSPSPGAGHDGRQSRGQLHINLPSANASVVHGTELQLGGPRSALRRPADDGPPSGRASQREQHSRDAFDPVRSLPPPPRFGNVLQPHELMSGEEIKEQNLIPMFKAEPLLAGKCLGLYLRRGGCAYENCGYCKKSMKEAPNTDPGDLERAVRRACGLANTRERTSTPGRGRSDSAGSDRSMGSQNSTGGGHKPKKGRQ
jgi:hypothetical protein